MKAAWLFAAAAIGVLLIASPRALPDGPALLAVEAVHLWKEVPVGRPLDVSFHLRNLSDREVVVARADDAGCLIRMTLLDPAGKPAPWALGVEREALTYPAATDFDRLAPGRLSRAILFERLMPVPQVRGRHLLRFVLVQARRRLPTLLERWNGGASPAPDVMDLMKEAWAGTLKGEIPIEVY